MTTTQKRKRRRAKAWVRRHELDIRLHALKVLFAVSKSLRALSPSKVTT